MPTSEADALATEIAEPVSLIPVVSEADASDAALTVAESGMPVVSAPVAVTAH